jgi:hypothetical protein
MPTGTDRPTFGVEYRAIIERYDARPNQCTIFPSDPRGAGRTTAWIAADEHSYVSLAVVR